MKIETPWVIFLTISYLCGIIIIILGFLFSEVLKGFFKK
jgi:MFS superfamily sulfate permease-like transporter